MALVCGLFSAHQAYAVQFVRIAPRQWRTPRNQASVNRFGICPGCLFILERGQHFKFRRKFRMIFISVAQDSRQVFATVIWNILADPPQANVPHAANARRIQHLQKCFGAFTTKTDCKYLWHVITIADLRQNRNRGLYRRVYIQESQHFCNMFKICRFFYGLGNCKLFIGLRTGCGSCVAAV